MKPAGNKNDGKTEAVDISGRRNQMTETTVKTGMNRREFFRDVGRLALLAGLAGVAAKVLAKGQITSPGRDCWNGSSCGGCPERDGCGELGAMKFKANQSAKAGKRGV